jgi:methylmalonyl-CoA/ethylmalonyl-CoA epimerase
MFNIHHIGIVVDSIEASLPLYCQMLGVDPAQVEYHDVPTEKVKVAMLKGNAIIELLEPTSEDSGLAKYKEKRGAGIHHICYAAPAPLQAKLDELKAAGFTLLDEKPRVGADGPVFFVHPKSTGGVLTEFVEV